jgi:hypothetical protein
MEKFGAASFYSLLKTMADLRNVAAEEINEGTTALVVSAETRDWMKGQAEELGNRCHFLGLRTSKKAAKAVALSIGDGDSVDVNSFHMAMKQLEQNLQWEMQDVRFFYLPTMRANYYDQKELFGVSVNNKFTTIQYDMVEAGNCYAMGRSTACVFHLMRIMEVGVQQFGNKLGVTFVDSKNWQNILDETNKAIRALPPKDAVTKTMSEISANLYAVKLAWRNEVMHPNVTYTLEEAENLIRQVKLFIGQLATII